MIMILKSYILLAHELKNKMQNPSTSKTQEGYRLNFVVSVQKDPMCIFVHFPAEAFLCQ